MRIDIHIGYPKTGTSSIQLFMATNRATLAGIGTLYPVAGALGHAHYGLTSALGLGFHAHADPALKPEAIYDAIMAEANASDCNRIVVSSENFILARDPRKVAHLFAGHEVHIIVYLRRHDTWFESAYNQSVRMVQNPPWGENAADFVQHQLTRSSLPCDYLQLLELWASVFGKSNLIVRPFEKAQNKPDLVSDFLAAIEVSSDKLTDHKATPGENRSVSPKTLMLIDRVQRSDLPRQMKQQVVRHLIASAPTTSEATHFLSPSLRYDLIEKFAPQYEKIAREYMQREDGRLFHAPIPERNTPWKEPTPHSWKEVTSLLLQACSGLLATKPE